MYLPGAASTARGNAILQATTRAASGWRDCSCPWASSRPRGYLPCVSLYLPYISLYLPYISWASSMRRGRACSRPIPPPHLPYISHRSPLYLRYISQASLLAAIALYAHCPLVHIELGALLERAGRARAALRQYERALQLSSDPSIDAGRAAAVGAARCSEMVAQRYGGSEGRSEGVSSYPHRPRSRARESA